MLDLAIKDLKGHKARTFLTVLGVIIAIAAIVSLGSISAGMNEYVDEQLTLLSGIVTLEEVGAIQAAGPPQGRIAISDVDEIEQIAGVSKIARAIIREPAFGEVVLGINFDAIDVLGMDELEFLEGDWPDPGEMKIVVGQTASETEDLSVGDSVEIENEILTVSGVLEETGQFSDFAKIMDLEVAQDIFDEQEFITFAYVKANDVNDIESIVEEVDDTYPNIDARSDEENIDRAREIIGQIRLITLGIGIITAIVAAIGIINTMFMSVFERKRQIGIMKAVGALEKQIVRQVLEESIVLAVFGSITGIIIGVIGTSIVNQAIGIPLAKVTPGLALGSFFFGLAITLTASVYPALQAAKIDPIEAIRS